jgi:hypothetical protein
LFPNHGTLLCFFRLEVLWFVIVHFDIAVYLLRLLSGDVLDHGSLTYSFLTSLTRPSHFARFACQSLHGHYWLLFNLSDDRFFLRWNNLLASDLASNHFRSVSSHLSLWIVDVVRLDFYFTGHVVNDFRVYSPRRHLVVPIQIIKGVIICLLIGRHVYLS